MKRKKIIILTMLSILIFGCAKNNEKILVENEKKELVIKTELTEEEKTRLSEIDAEIQKHKETKEKSLAKCRGNAYKFEEYNKCIKKANIKYEEVTKDIVEEKKNIENTLGQPLEDLK